MKAKMRSKSAGEKKDCPLCNGKSFSQGDDFKTLCTNHATEVISLLILDICGAMGLDSMMKKGRSAQHVTQ